MSTTFYVATAYFLSPETYLNDVDIMSEKVDVFSFGVIMYELTHKYLNVMAVALHGLESELESYAYRVSQGYRPPIRESFPHEMRLLISACWAQEPNISVAAMDGANPGVSLISVCAMTGMVCPMTVYNRFAYISVCALDGATSVFALDGATTVFAYHQCLRYDGATPVSYSSVWGYARDILCFADPSVLRFDGATPALAYTSVLRYDGFGAMTGGYTCVCLLSVCC
eukprot:gene27228-2482_t